MNIGLGCAADCGCCASHGGGGPAPLPAPGVVSGIRGFFSRHRLLVGVGLAVLAVCFFMGVRRE